MLRIESDTVFSLWDGFRALSLCRQKKIHNTIKERQKQQKAEYDLFKAGEHLEAQKRNVLVGERQKTNTYDTELFRCAKCPSELPLCSY